MIFRKTKLNDACIIDLEKIEDDRGFFARAFCLNELKEYGIDFPIAQVNVSFSKIRGTLRGLHFQRQPYRESKLMRCTKGSIYDVIIDMRPNSSTFMQWLGAELSERNHRMLYVPEGFAHGYLTLEDNTEVTYPVSEFYTPGAEDGIRWDDQAFAIDWPIEPKVISEKDQSWPDYEETVEV